MQESFYDYMKVGIIHFMAYPDTIGGEGPIVETITKIAADDFFTAIEITWIKDPAVRAQAKAVLDTSCNHGAAGWKSIFHSSGLNGPEFDLIRSPFL